jgi:DNA polymerase III sliding clamp (beta) subunit (PCNA family)
LNDVIGYSEIERLYNRNPNADNEFDDERFIKLVGRIKKSDNAQQFRYRYQGVHIEIELNI